MVIEPSHACELAFIKCGDVCRFCAFHTFVEKAHIWLQFQLFILALAVGEKRNENIQVPKTLLGFQNFWEQNRNRTKQCEVWVEWGVWSLLAEQSSTCLLRSKTHSVQSSFLPQDCSLAILRYRYFCLHHWTPVWWDDGIAMKPAEVCSAEYAHSLWGYNGKI